MNRINALCYPRAVNFGNSGLDLGGNPFRFPATQATQRAWQSFLQNTACQQKAETSAQALTPQDAEAPVESDPARELAKQSEQVFDKMEITEADLDPKAVKRRAYEYDRHYGLTLIGKAVS